jgi:hypothetical protein
VEDDLFDLLIKQQVSCRLWPEQTEGPYHRDVHPQRRDITENLDGLTLRVGLRLLKILNGGGYRIWLTAGAVCGMPGW